MRRGEGDRDAVRMMRQAARDGHVVGLFVEGTRQTHGRARDGAARCRDGRDAGGRAGRPGRGLRDAVLADRQLQARAPSPIGEPLRFDGLPKGGKGYKEATVEIERRINVLFDWLADVHAGRPPI